MTTIELDSVYDWTTAPAVVPRAYGAFSVFSFEDRGGHADFGAQWESVECFKDLSTGNVCADPEVAALTPEQCTQIGLAEPFTVYGYYTDSLAGGLDEVSWRERFLAGEQWGVEAGILAYLQAHDTPSAPTLVVTDPMQKVAAAVAEAEGAAVDLVNGERILFMGTQFASLAASLGVIEARTTNVMRTALGSKVVVMGPDLGWTIYSSGSWVAHRSALGDDSGAPAMTVNNASGLFQRSYAMGTACGVVSVDSGLGA